ncbi:hypothetical protein [Eisenbergiella sp.]
MKRLLCVLDVLKFSWNDNIVVEFFGKNGNSIGKCPIEYVPISLWYVIVDCVEIVDNGIHLTCDILENGLNLKADEEGRLYPYAFTLH